MTTLLKYPSLSRPTLTRPQRAHLTLVALTFLLGLAILLGIGLGAVAITPLQQIAIVADHFGGWPGLEVSYEARQAAVLLTIRLPRVLLGVLVGASLAISGAAIQGLFRNPLAAPGLIGISSGASLGVVLFIVLGHTILAGITQLLGRFTLPAGAFVGGLITTFVVYQLAQQQGRTQVTTLLLAGVAINALTGAIVGLLTFMASDEQLRTITFWSLGSLGGATWQSFLMVAPLMLLSLLALPWLARPLNLLLLGESEAGHLGVSVEKLKYVVIIWVALGVGSAVAVSGNIGFIGLVAPHLVRLWLGPDHHYVLPGSALLGAILLLIADLLARTLVVPAELPIGIVTALIGAPFFLWLLLKNGS